VDPHGGNAGARYTPGANCFARRIPPSTGLRKSLLIDASRATAAARVSPDGTIGSSTASNMCPALQPPLTDQVPSEGKFTKGVDIYEVQAHMTNYVTSTR
jgi:hypothetical protein